MLTSLDSIMKAFTKLKINDSNKRVVAEAYLVFLREVKQTYNIDGRVETYERIMLKKLKSYKRYHRVLYRKLFPTVHDMREVRELSNIIANVRIYTHEFATLMEGLRAVLSVMLSNVSILVIHAEYYHLIDDNNWLAMAIRDLDLRSCDCTDKYTIDTD